MKLNRLSGHGVVDIKDDRQTGKSLGLAFEIIGRALKNPNQVIPVKDHHGTRESDRMLFRKVVDLVQSLNLELFQFNHVLMEVQYKLYEEVDHPNIILYNNNLYFRG